jgi:hypothetical protein
MRVHSAYNCNHAVILEKEPQLGYELDREELRRLCSSCKYIVDNVIILARRIVNKHRGILHKGGEILRQSEVVSSKFDHNGV